MIEIGEKRWITTGSTPKQVTVMEHADERYRVASVATGVDECLWHLAVDLHESKGDAMIATIAENATRMEQNAAENAHLMACNRALIGDLLFPGARNAT